MDPRMRLFLLLIITTLFDVGMSLKECAIDVERTRHNQFNGRGEIYCDGVLYYNTNSWPVARYNYYNSIQYQMKLWLNNLDEEQINSGSLFPPTIPKSGFIEFKLTNCEIFSVPSEVFTIYSVRNIQLTENKIERIDFSLFLNMNDLVSINASNNNIELLDSEDNTKITTINKVELIDLSYNSIQHIPNNYFTEFTNLLHLNLTHNDIKQFGLLSFEGLSKLNFLYVSNNKLKAIDNTLMRFVNLQELILDHNHITSLTEPNFKLMSKLQKLNISSNYISHIEENTFQNLNEMIMLDLKNNNISILSRNLFASNRKIEVIDLSHNKIKTVKHIFEGMNVSHFNIQNNHIADDLDNTTFVGISVGILDLSNNRFCSINTDPFSNHGSEVTVLNLKNNYISNISNTAFQSLRLLNELDLSSNNITELYFNLSNNRELKYLNISHNKLKKITKFLLSNLTLLTTLDFSYNLISDVEPHAFEDLSNLKAFGINNNLLTHSIKSHFFHGMTSLSRLELINIRADVYENYTFSGLNSLKVLNSSHGELEVIHYGAFNGSGPIEILDLSHNVLELFLVDLKTISKVKQLQLQNNKLKYVTKDMFYQLNNLYLLNIASNNILEIDANSFKTTQILLLNISDNEALNLKGLEFENINSLHELLLTNIKKPFSFEKVQNMSVIKLNISSCNIKIIQSLFIYKIKLVHNLNLSSNKITYIDKHSFQNMPSLSVLDLRFNLISSIQPGAFLQTNMINILNLHSNYISSLKYGVFDGLSNLHSLDLSSNLLHSFGANFLHNAPTVTTIYLDDNIIEHINFNNFVETSVVEISVGGNLINCDEFIGFKKYIPVSLKITAHRKDFHSENVDGITCKTVSKVDGDHSLSHNDTVLPNITVAFNTLANAMEMFRDTIEDIARNSAYKQNDAIIKKEEDVLISLNKLIKVYNESQSMTNIYLKQLIDKDGNSQLIIGDHYKADNSNSELNIPVYVTLGCLVILLGLFIYLIYTYYKWRNTKLEDNNLSSNQQLTNDIEME